MKEDWISSSMTTCWTLSADSANVSCLPRGALRVDERFLGVLLDELAARLDVLAHQDAEHPVRRRGVLQHDLLQHAGVGVHRGLPKLVGVHLPQALEPGHLD